MTVPGIQSRILQQGISDSGDLDTVDVERRWVIETDGSDVTILDVWAKYPDMAPGYIDQSLLLMVTDCTAESAESSEFLEVVVTWSSVDSEDPLQMKMEWEGKSSIIEIPAFYDLDGKAIVNTAGEPIEGLTQKIKVWQFTGVRNVANIPSWLGAYGQACNSDDVRIRNFLIRKGQGFLADVQIGREQEVKYRSGKRLFSELKVEIWWRSDGWDDVVLNSGYYELVGVRELVKFKMETVYKAKRALDEEGEPTAEKVLLGLDGRRLRDKNGKPLTTGIKASDIVTLKFRNNELLPFRPLVT